MDESDDLLQTIENRRKFYLRVWLFFTTVILIALGTSFVMLGARPEVLGSVLFLLTIIVGILALTGSFFVIKNRYRQKSKTRFLEEIARRLELEYYPKGAFDMRLLHQHGILPPFDQALSEDGFSGQTNRFPLSFQEVRLRKKEYDEDAKSFKIYQQFQGLVIRIQLRRSLDFHTVLLPNKFLRPNVDIGNIPAQKGMAKVNIVSPRFAKAYSLYSTDQIESRTVFDPIFIERFLELGEHIGSKWMEASFREDELLIMAHFNKNFFELRGLLRTNRPEDLQAIEEEIRHIFKISEILKHNMYLAPKS
jgi:hypothetical protein